MGGLESIISIIIDLSYIGSFGRTNFNTCTNCGIMLLFLRSWDFCTYREVLLGELSTRYSTQINALYGSIALYARIQALW